VDHYLYGIKLMARKNGKTTKQRQANKASKKAAPKKSAKKAASLPKIDKVKTSVRRAKSTSNTHT
jgi:hypothetical protein